MEKTGFIIIMVLEYSIVISFQDKNKKEIIYYEKLEVNSQKIEKIVLLENFNGEIDVEVLRRNKKVYIMSERKRTDNFNSYLEGFYLNIQEANLDLINSVGGLK